MQGWVSFHRKIEEWEWYDDANTFRLFFHLVLKANHKDNKWRGIDIKRGELVTSNEQLAKQLKLTVSKIRTSLNKLKSTQEITIKTTNKNTVVTVVNYSLYQSTETEIATKTTIKSQSNRNQIATNNNDNNEKNEIIKDIVEHLNFKTSSNYRPSGKKTKDIIKARINEGFTVEDFKKVIDIKTTEWLNTDMAKFLRPETLFSNKFEGYLNQKEVKAKQPDNSKNKFHGFKQHEKKYTNDELKAKLAKRNGG